MQNLELLAVGYCRGCEFKLKLAELGLLPNSNWDAQNFSEIELKLRQKCFKFAGLVAVGLLLFEVCEGQFAEPDLTIQPSSILEVHIAH